jgi:uncharacterized membrane protein YphA (DoxX/SURF4 family)
MEKKIPLSVRLLLGMIFLISALAKFLSPAAFGESLSSFGLLSSAAVPVFTYLLPALELLLALALLFRVQVEKAALFGAVMLVIFMAAAASAALSGVEVENCGCFGELYRSSLGVGFFVRNGVLLLLSLFLVGWNETTPANEEGIELPNL